MNLKWLVLIIVLFLTCNYSHCQGYYILGSSGIGRPIMSGEEANGRYSFPISTSWFFNEFRIPGIYAGYENWGLQAEDSRGELRNLYMSFFDLGVSWSIFQSRILGIRGGWVFPLNIPIGSISNKTGPKGPYAGIFILGNLDPYWLELGFKRYFWRTSASFGTSRTPEMWTIDPPKGIIYITIHYRLFEYY